MVDFVKESKMSKLRGMLDEIYESDDARISSWEIDFLETLTNWENQFTEKQAKTLKEIHKKVCK